ncbi:MAG: ABC transporter ATP-binding protein [Eubacterium sp.]|nr:ABC transporter ATP-binding protein [Eubacterium sp.]
MAEAVISLDGIVKSYGRNKVLKGVDMTVRRGDIYGLIGKNGAGKTTLFKVVLGLSSYESGRLSILGGGNSTENNENRHHIGFFVGANFFGYLSGRANLDYFRRVKGIADKKEIDRVLEIVGLDKKAAAAQVKRYSLGMRQRLGIANALLGSPDILILDEPANGLDPQGILDVRNIITKLNKEYGKTIIVSSHILSELEHTAHRFGIVHEGIIMREMSEEQMKIKGGYADIRIEGSDLEKAKKLLSDGGVKISSIEQATTSLEDFYFDLVGSADEGSGTAPGSTGNPAVKASGRGGDKK